MHVDVSNTNIMHVDVSNTNIDAGQKIHRSRTRAADDNKPRIADLTERERWHTLALTLKSCVMHHETRVTTVYQHHAIETSALQLVIPM